MTRRLEEILKLPPIEQDEDELATKQPEKTKETLIAEAAEVMNALTTSEKIEVALTTVTGLHQHDDEMDEIADRALKSYQELVDMALNMPDMYTGKVYEVACQMLKTAMEAKDAKVQKKLKMLDLQMKKYRIDKVEAKFKSKNSDDDGEQGADFDRNELLQHIIDNQKSVETDK